MFIAIISATVIPFCTMYIIGAIGFWDFNPAEWHLVVRFLLGALATVWWTWTCICIMDDKSRN